MEDVVDAAFAIECRSLPVDHAYALSAAIQAALPWFAGEPQAGLARVHLPQLPGQSPHWRQRSAHYRGHEN